jgi:hypothetical protein
MWYSPVKGRAGQMNCVKMLKVMYTSFYMLIASQQPIFDVVAIDEGYDCGSFRTQFDSSSLLLKSTPSLQDSNFRGGDQGVLLPKNYGIILVNTKKKMVIMEDYDYIARLWKLVCINSQSYANFSPKIRRVLAYSLAS